MKTKFNGILTLLLALVVQFSFAQEKTVSGTVSDNSGALPGVSVLIKGTQKGTETDFDGKYSLKAKVGDVLVFSYIGYKTVEKTVGSSNVINVKLEEGGEILDEVVVTALGVSREKKALGYAVSKVKAADINQKAEGDIGRVLAGKASGVNITQQSGMSGSGTKILIRGLNSFSGSNQPLFIVDGVAFSTDTNTTGSLTDGNNGSSRFLDLDPNNIESVNILKGLAAATLYGTEGRNGVIIITTKAGATGKKGPKKTEVTITSSLVINEINSIPNYQNEYGGGFDQAFGWFFSNWGPSFKKDGPAGWGGQAAINGTNSGTPGYLVHPYLTANTSSQGGPVDWVGLGLVDPLYKWQPYNGVKDFFRTGVVKQTNINLSARSDDGKMSYNVNYGNMNDQGFTPGNRVLRNTLSIGGNAKLSNKISVNATLNLARTDFVSPPVAAGFGSNVGGEGASIFANLFYTPRSIDLMNLPYENPFTHESVYYRQGNDIQHPLWTVKNAKTQQITNRIYGGAGVSYAVKDNMNLNYKYGVDIYSTSSVVSSNKGGKTGSQDNRDGLLKTANITNMIQEHNFSLSGSYNFNEDLDMNYVIGANSKSEQWKSAGIRSSQQQIYGLLQHYNFVNHKPYAEFSGKRNILGVYGQAELGYQKYLYLTLAGRKDWVSNLTTANRSIFYPSASISFLPAKVIESLQESSVVNFLKLRIGYGTSANFPGGHPTSVSLYENTQSSIDVNGNFVVTSGNSGFLGNPDLKPERIDELEFGVETTMFKNRLTLDASVYKRVTKNLIVRQPLDPASGYSVTQTNIGRIDINGVEIDLGYDLFKSKDNGFNWNANINWTTNKSVVKDLGQNNDIIHFGGAYSNLGNAAIVGESLGTMIGSAIDRDANGNYKVDAAGSYVVKNGDNIIGDATPDFNLNYSNSFSYKNFSLSTLFTWAQGGDIYSQTVSTLLGRGVVAQEGIDRANSFILPGVNPAGQQNTTMINNSTYYFNNVMGGPSELSVYDATVFTLQEVSLSYQLSKKALENTPFGSVSFTLTGNNLWFYAPNIPKNTNFNPAVAGLGVTNGSGFEFLNAPTARRFGFSFKAQF